MNADYSICQALNYHSDGFNRGDVIYDIACQWSIHFAERVQRSTSLSLSEKMKIFAAVGKFHLGAHVKECFSKFSLNFLEGAGLIDGEIVETTWSNLNHVASSTRVMSKGHRREVLDAHMREANWKKLTGMCKLCFNWGSLKIVAECSIYQQNR